MILSKPKLSFSKQNVECAKGVWYIKLMQQEAKQPIVNNFQSTLGNTIKVGKASKLGKFLLPVVALVVILVGIGGGWLVSGKYGGNTSTGGVERSGVKEGEKEAGIADEETFSDSATGMLVAGGID